MAQMELMRWKKRIRIVRTDLQTRPIEQLHTRTALESRPHRFLDIDYES